MPSLDGKLFKFEEHYRYLESSFIDITQTIPLENTPDTFSPRLYEILQSVCSQVDGIVNLMHEKYISASRKPTAVLYKALNREGVISHQTLVYKSRSEWKEIRPFLCHFGCAFRSEDDDPHACGPHKPMPRWWKAYNKSKHRLPEEYKAGNIGKHVPCPGRTVPVACHDAAVITQQRQFLEVEILDATTPAHV